jgi:hypothetical protein
MDLKPFNRQVRQEHQNKDLISLVVLGELGGEKKQFG